MAEKIKVLLLRTNKVDPDPRVEKEVNSLLTNKNILIEVLAWDRTDNYKYHKDILMLENGSAIIHRIGIMAGWGVGIKKNAMAFFKYAFNTFVWLMKHHKEYDVIHACDLQTIIPSFIPVKLYRKKLVYDIFDYFSDTAHGNKVVLSIAKNFETRVIEKADATIICCEKRIEQIKPAIPNRLVVIHNAPSRLQVQTDSRGICRSNTGVPKLVYVGNLVEDRCIREIVEIARRCQNIEVHIGGMGTLADFVEESSKSIANLFFYGRMKYSDVLALEKECDIMIAFYDQRVLNHKYAAPNKFYEALGLGKPLIMLHNTGVDDVIDKYDLGITVDQNVEDMINGIENLLQRKNDWALIELKSKKLFDDEYCWEIMGNRLNALYNEISLMFHNS